MPDRNQTLTQLFWEKRWLADIYPWNIIKEIERNFIIYNDRFASGVQHTRAWLGNNLARNMMSYSGRRKSWDYAAWSGVDLILAEPVATVRDMKQI